MKVAPAVAAVPAADMIAILMRKVSTVVIGMRKPPSFLRGAATAATRWRSHCDACTAYAKPMAAQMGGTSVRLVMPLTNASKAFMGAPEAAQSTKPETTSNMRVSQRLASPYTMKTTDKTASQICHVMVGNLLWDGVSVRVEVFR